MRFTLNSNKYNIYYTVRILGLSFDTTIIKFLKKVRGSIVFNIKLLNTKSITSNITRLVIFFYKYVVIIYKEYA